MRPRHWLPKVVARADVSPAALVMAHRALLKLPPPVCERLWAHSYGLSLFGAFDWVSAGEENGTFRGASWKSTGGYWDETRGYAAINAAWCQSQDDMDAVVFHEIGHALSINILPKPHRTPSFRAGWTTGRKRVRARFPAAYAGQTHMGVFCIQWTRAVQEVWAECFAWLMGARSQTHPTFAECFPECLDLVRADIAPLMEQAA